MSARESAIYRAWWLRRYSLAEIHTLFGEFAGVDLDMQPCLAAKCEQCGGEFVPRARSGPHQRYCSEMCRKRTSRRRAA